jgi:hypothetical protein
MTKSNFIFLKKIKVCIICFAILFSTLVPRSAQAIDVILLPAGIILLFTGTTDGLFTMTRSMPTPDPISVLLTLPLFLLAEKNPSVLGSNEVHLQQQGYTQEEIEGMKSDIEKIRREGRKNNLHFQTPEDFKVWLKSLQLSPISYEQLLINS